MYDSILDFNNLIEYFLQTLTLLFKMKMNRFYTLKNLVICQVQLFCRLPSIRNSGMKQDEENGTYFVILPQ